MNASSGSPWRTWVVLALAGPPLAALAFVLATVAFVWPDWWRAINLERSPLTWYSSMQLVLIGAAGLLASLTTFETATARRAILWCLFGAAFFVLATDEYFAIHERLREGFFKPHHIGTAIPGIGPGDFLLPLYAIAGLAVAYGLLPCFRADRLVLTLAVVGVALALTAIGLDITHTTPRADHIGSFRVAQAVEELLETAAQSAWLSSLCLLNVRALERRLA